MTLYDALDASETISGVQAAKNVTANLRVYRSKDAKHMPVYRVQPLNGSGKAQEYRSTSKLQIALQSSVLDGWEVA